ncbi:hypothetical protein NC652_039627 [Populus alba x Populus x berolinensis]|nr:hypothetical protein NC652_039627 [Populus alba x Populus x berolinensis]
MHQGPEVCISGVKFLIKCMKTLKAKEHMIVAANNILKRCFRKQGGFPSLYRRKPQGKLCSQLEIIQSIPAQIIVRC